MTAAAGVLHVIVASFYFGTHVYAAMFFLPSMREAKTNAELAVLQKVFKKFGPLFGGLGMGALITGLLYTFAKFGTDLGSWVSNPEPRTIVVALFIFLAMIVIATTVHRPIAEWIIAQDLTGEPGAAPSAEMKVHIEKFAKVAHVTTAGVLVVIVLMVLARNGGI